MMNANTIESCKTLGETTPLLSEQEVWGLVEEIGRQIYHQVTPFEIAAWRTPEPVPFPQRRSGEELHLKTGMRWGERLFDCAWFRFRAPLPKMLEGELVARIDINGELLLVDAEGNPLRGLTCVKSVFDRKLGTPGKTIWAVPESALCGERIEIWADAAFNDLFGSISGEGRIEFAELCICRSDVRALYYDVEVLTDYLASLGPGNAERGQILSALSQAAETLGGYEEEPVARAREILRPFFCREKEGNLEVSAVGHAHLDLAWLWPIRETIRKGARTFANALYNIERYPEYVFGASQPQLFAWMKEHYPVLYARIREAVKAGRIELQGTFWVEPDCSIPCGESFVRQILHGARFFQEEFGKTPNYCWEPDVFGYHGQLPQILRKSGCAFFMTQKLSWNVVNRFPHHAFHWRGIDGTSILAHMLAEETYNSPAAPHSLRKIAGEYAQREVSNHALMVYGIGDGGGGPDAEHLERLQRCDGLSALPRVKMCAAGEFFSLWKADAEQFPTWNGELYLERHQGTLTTQALTKRNNRLCEIGLRELEWAAAVASEVAAIAYPAVELDRLWKEVLLYQFHDILPGSSIQRVYAECNARQIVILQRIEELTRERYAAIAARVRTQASHIIFNALPWARREWINLGGQWGHVHVPPMGFVSAGWGTVRPAGAGLRAGPGLLENERLRVEIATDGSLRSIYDKACGREILDATQRGNDLVIFEDEGDAWDFATDHERKDVWIYLRQAPQCPTLVSSRALLDGPCAILEQTFRFGASTIFQQIILKEGEDLLEFRTRATWADPRTMLRVRFPLSVCAEKARFEIPFGSIERSTSEETLMDRAQIEVSAQQWVDLSDATYGVSLINDSKYGFRVKGNTLDMCLLRSVPYPGSALIAKEDRSEDNQGECTDLGEHEFRYALWPHAGKAGEAEITRQARSFNAPLHAVDCADASRPTLPDLPDTYSWITLSNPAIEIAAVKQTEDEQGWIARLVNVASTPEQGDFVWHLPCGFLEETDLVEKPVSLRRTLAKGEPVRISMTPFEIKTFRVGRG